MPNDYNPVSYRTKKKKQESTESLSPKVKIETPSTKTVSKTVRDVVRVEHLEDEQETYDKIVDLSASGYSANIIAYMLGVTTKVFNDFRMLHSEKVEAAIDMGRIIDEAEIVERLRTAAMSSQTNALTALQAYGKIYFGWLGNNQNSSRTQELPSSIKFTAIEPNNFRDEDI